MVGSRVLRTAVPLVAILVPQACQRAAPGPASIRLVDGFQARQVAGTSARAVASLARTEFRFDGPPPAAPPGPPSRGGAAPAAGATTLSATRGWVAHAVDGLAVKDGRLVGQSASHFPILHLERTSGLDNVDHSTRWNCGSGSPAARTSSCRPARRRPWT